MKYHIYRGCKRKRKLFVDADGDWCAFAQNAHDFGSDALAREFISGKRNEIMKKIKASWIDKLNHEEVITLLDKLQDWNDARVASL